MWELIRKHPRAVLVAAFIHLFLLAFFIVSVDWHRDVPAPAQPIKARAIIDPKEVAELKKQIEPPPPEPEVDERKQREEALAEQRRREEEERQAELKKKQEAEKRQQAKLKKKQELEKKRLA